MKLQKRDQIGLNHDKVIERYEGDLSFVNYMAIKLKCGRNTIGGVYKAANPNRDKGHQDYMIIYSNYDPILMRRDLYVIGRTPEEMEANRYHNGIHCLECDEVVISFSQHDYVTCDCENKAMMDGGQFNPYNRYGAKDMSKIRSVIVDMFTDEIKVVDEK